MAIKHKDIWTALAAPFMVKFGVVRQSDISGMDLSLPVGWQITQDDASGVAQPIMGNNAGGLNVLGNTNGTVSAGPFLRNPGATAQTSSSATGITLSNAQMLNYLFLRTGAGSAQTDTTRTAAQLVAAIPGVAVGYAFELVYKNASSNDVILGLGSGVSKGNSGDTVTITAGNVARFLFVFTNVTASSEAVKVYSLGQTAS